MTPSIIVEVARTDDIKAAQNAGARIVDEGLDGKALLAVDSIAQVVRICELLGKREVGSVTPNILPRVTPSVARSGARTQGRGGKGAVVCVFIKTTDITGPNGYDAANYTKTLNGTSSATPFVAGTAALMISANPGITASAVRTILSATAKPIMAQTGWTKELGYGRLDVAAADAAAKRHP